MYKYTFIAFLILCSALGIDRNYFDGKYLSWIYSNIYLFFYVIYLSWYVLETDPSLIEAKKEIKELSERIENLKKLEGKIKVLEKDVDHLYDRVEPKKLTKNFPRAPDY